MNIPVISVVAGAAPWFAWLMMHPRVLTAVAVVLSLVQLNWLSRYFGAPAIFGRISLLVTGLLAIRLLVDVVVQKRRLGDQQLILIPVVWLTGYFLVLMFFSNVYNGESLLLGVFELRYYFFGFTICFALYEYYGDLLSLSFFKRALVWIGVVQVPVSILKWTVAGGGRALTLDSVTGTFSDYGELVACQLVVLCIVLFEEMTSRERLLRINNNLLCLLILVPLLLSKSRTATIFVVLVLLFTWFLGALQKEEFSFVLKKTLKVLLLGGCVLGLLYQFFWKTNYDIKVQLNPSHVFAYYMRPPVANYENYKEGEDPVMGRGRAVQEAVTLIFSHPVNALVGYGAGATAEASFLGTNGKYYQRYGALAGLGRNHYSKVITEFGLLGMAGFAFFFWLLFFRLKRDFSIYSSMFNVYLLLLFLLVFLSIYACTLTSFFFSFVLAFFFATSQTEYDKMSQTEEVSEES